MFGFVVYACARVCGRTHVHVCACVHPSFCQQVALETLRMHGCHLPTSPLSCLPEMLQSGVSLVLEPFVQVCLSSLVKLTLRDLQDRSRIPVERSAVLMGIMDEESVLQYGEVRASVKSFTDERCTSRVCQYHVSVHTMYKRVR